MKRMQGVLSWAFSADGLLLVGFLAVMWAAIYHRAWLRARRLASIDPPTAEELAEIEELLGRPGSFSISGPSSASARHFASYQGRGQRLGQGGARSNHEARIVDAWHHRRDTD